MSIVFFLIIIGVVVLTIISYNSLQKLSQNVKEKASNVQVAVSKKLSLINQLIDVVRNYQESEQFTLLQISQDANTSSLMASYQQSGAVLSSIQGVAERFPNLKASDQYQRLMDNITHCEINIQQNREKYNANVNTYNSNRSGIPTVFVAQFLGFSEAPYLQFDLVGNDATSLKEFKTDDGERLKQMFKSAGNNIADATKNLSSQATKLIAAKSAIKSSDLFYYLLPNGLPKGPKPLNEIRKMIDEGVLSTGTKVALSGSDEWNDIEDVHKTV